MMKFNKWEDWSKLLVGLGGLTWGTVSWFNFNVVTWLASLVPTITWIPVAIYSAIAVAGGLVLYELFQ